MSHRMTTTWIDGATQVLIGATAVAAACVALLGTGLRANGEPRANRFRAAMDVYDARRWPQAYAQMSAAADAGDASAARVAAMMARHGPALFGQRFDVSPERLRRWDLVVQRGRATGSADASTSAQAPSTELPAEIQIAHR